MRKHTASTYFDVQEPSIAILMAFSHYTFDRFQQGFVEGLLQVWDFNAYSFETFNAKGDEELCAFYVAYIVENNYDLFLSISFDSWELLLVDEHQGLICFSCQCSVGRFDSRYSGLHAADHAYSLLCNGSFASPLPTNPLELKEAILKARNSLFYKKLRGSTGLPPHNTSK